jgi:Na+-driven multidrug efflux pump
VVFWRGALVRFATRATVGELEIPLAWVLSHPLGLGPTGVFIAMTVAFCTMAVIGVVLFKRGRWKQVKV